MTRPEAGDEYGYQLPDSYDQDAWKDFTPYRVGDPPTRTNREVELESGTEQTAGRNHGGDDEMARRLQAGDKVRSTISAGGVLGGAVPVGTVGQVVSTRSGVFTDYATVKFSNGYTEEVKASDLKYESGWY